MRKIVYINIDGIIAEFESKMFCQIKSIVQNEHYEFRSALYEIAPPVTGGVEAVQSILKMDGIEVFFISTPIWDDADIWSEKKQWFNHLFQSIMVKGRLFLCHQKQLLRGDYLIDQSWRFGSKKFQGSWLQIGVDPRFPCWDEVLEYLIDEIKS